MRRGLGYRPEAHDERDRLFRTTRLSGVARAESSRIYELVTTIWDQGPSSACVGHSGASGVKLRRTLDGHRPVDLSRHDYYWGARAEDGYQNEDAGAHIRSGVRYAHKVGLSTESASPFELARINERPSMAAEIEGLTRADGVYERISLGGAAQVEAVLDALQADCPVLFGTQVTAAFMDHVGAKTLPAPAPGTEFIGGHALLAAGFDRFGSRIRIVNSWSTGWGDSGMAWVSAEWFALPTTGDVWVLRPQPKESA